MGLDSSDPRPVGMSSSEAYASVRSWFQANIARLERDPKRGKQAAAVKTYVASMPEPSKATHEDMLEAFRRVLSGDLEFAYHDSDGKYKMAAYAEVGRDKSRGHSSTIP